jgi:hypothetical protein
MPICYCAFLQAGQLLLFLRQNLQLPDDALLPKLKWAASLRPSSTQASMQAVTQALQQQLPLSDDQVLPALSLFPDVLGWDVQGELLPKLKFFDSLGPAGKRLLDTMYDEDTGYLQVCRRGSCSNSTSNSSSVCQWLQNVMLCWEPMPASAYCVVVCHPSNAGV